MFANRCDYLNYVVKESMRIDPPTFATTSYKTLENLTICGVPVAKGTKLSVNIGKTWLLSKTSSILMLK